MKTLHELLVHQILDLHSAEKQLLAALPEIAELATDQELSDAISIHLEETKHHVKRLEQACEILGAQPGNKTCEGMKGILKEFTLIKDEIPAGPLLDAAIIDTAQRVEHYEIAGYSSAALCAETLEQEDVRELLDTTLAEEDNTSALLDELASSKILDEAI